MSRSRLLAVAASFALLACRKAPEPEGGSVEPQAPAAPPSAAPAAPALPHDTEKAPSARATWTDPPRWTRSPSSSPMRLATYRVPKASGDAEDGELAVFYFGPGQGGDVGANLDRWKRQFSDVKKDDVRQTERTVNGLPAHVLEIERGIFASGMPGQPTTANKGYALIGAIVETPAGSYFFKLTAPEKTVKSARAEFFSMLDSVKLGSAP